MTIRTLTPLLAAGAVVGAAAQEPSTTRDESAEIEELVVTADLDSLPGDDVSSLFGFYKSLLATPRSASTVSDEMMDRFIVRDIDEMIALAPGSFTQSFFGVAGTLDIRGTPGETYFRGMRRLDNPGNYPTPLGASKRVDIVRGPASPIHGPSKIGGYLNFAPKSARIEETGEFIDTPTGTVGVDLGSWERRVLTAEVGGPARLGTQDFGYWLYGMTENSGSYYRNSEIEQALLQASFDLDVGAVQFQFGGMYHDFAGNQIAGWNRLTQDLVDRGLYITGSPAPLDVDGDGYISHQEFDIDGDGFTDFNPFAAGLMPGTRDALNPEGPFPGSCTIGSTLVFGCLPGLLALESSGTTTITGDQVLVGPEDVLLNDVLTLYFDTIVIGGGNWEWRNQAFFETYDNLNENDYGFSQFHDSWVFENKLVAANEFRLGEAQAAVQVSPSVRITDFDHGDDYTNEYFDRRDITRPSSALAKRLLSTRIDDDYTEYYIGSTVNFGLAALADIAWRRISVLTGARYDRVDLESRQPVEKLLLASSNNFCLDASCVVVDAADEGGRRVVDVQLELSRRRRVDPVRDRVAPSDGDRGPGCRGGDGEHLGRRGVRRLDATRIRHQGQPARREALLRARGVRAGTHGLLRPANGHQPGQSHAGPGVRGALGDDRALADDTRLFRHRGGQPKHTPGRPAFQLHRCRRRTRHVAPEALYAGALGGSVLRTGNEGARRAGIPEKIWALTGTYDFGVGWAASASVVDVAATNSGFSGSVRLPAYTLVNAGLVVERDNWVASVTAKNLTDERYFRANFPNLFGGVIVLPELPRHFAARIQYQW